MTRPRDDLYWLRFPEKSTESPQCPFAYRGFTLIYGFFHPDGIIENPTIKFYYPFMPRIFCIFNGLSIYTLAFGEDGISDWNKYWLSENSDF